MGNQGTSSNGLRYGVELIRSGAIGEVREVHVWTNRPIWPQNINRPAERQDVPKTLHWDLWLGPAPDAPTTGPICRSTGAAAGTSAPARWATWVATR